MQSAKNALRFRCANSPNAGRCQRRQRVGNNVAARQRQFQPRALSVFHQNKGRAQGAAIFDRFRAIIGGTVDPVRQDTSRRMRSKRRHQRIVGVQNSNRVAPVQSLNQLALGQRNFLDRSKKFQVRRRNPRDHANVRLGDRGELL